MSFTPRTEIPAKDNPYYIPIADGGLNPCIAKPKGSTLPFQNCVFYAWGRFNEIAGTTDLLRSCNAEDFIAAAQKQGLEIGQVPRLGAVAVWAKGKTGNGSDGAGHVAIVEHIHSGGFIITSESGWSAKQPFWTTTRKDDGNWCQSSAYRFLGFIYNPAVPNTVRTMRRGDTGDDVMHLQGVLAGLGYYGGELDGKYGKQTMSAVCGFQLDERMEIDGICGPKTRAALSL